MLSSSSATSTRTGSGGFEGSDVSLTAPILAAASPFGNLAFGAEVPGVTDP